MFFGLLLLGFVVLWFIGFADPGHSVASRFVLPQIATDCHWTFVVACAGHVLTLFAILGTFVGHRWESSVGADSEQLGVRLDRLGVTLGPLAPSWFPFNSIWFH